MSMFRQKNKNHVPYTPARVALGWFLAFLVGWIAAIMLVVVISNAIRIPFLSVFSEDTFHTSPLQFLFLVLLLFVELYAVGNIVGYFQWKGALQDIVPKHKWLRASILMTFVLIAAPLIKTHLFGDTSLYICGYDAGWVTKCTLAPDWQTLFLFDTVFYGFAIGLPQWWTLRRYVKRANWWIVANLVGMTLDQIITINQYENHFGSFFIGLDILIYSIPLYALITSLTMYYIARGETQKRKFSPTQ